MSRLDNQRRLFLELLEELRPHWRRDPALPARLQHWLARKRAGSRDRRLYRELAYTALRILPWIETKTPEEAVGLVAACASVEPATAEFIAAHRVGSLPPDCEPSLLLPDWLPAECPAATEPRQRDALLTRAPVWLRLQTGDTALVREDLAAGGWTVTPATVLEGAWRLEGSGDVTTTRSYREGWFEVQDLGSQLLLAVVGPRRGEHWLDACAGAGGKTLQLAFAVGAEGRVDAYDVRRAALDELERRSVRARRRNVHIRPQPPGGRYDAILVDAPCSGSGTWRRAPHLKWITSPADIRRAADRQLDLLARWAPQVVPGGQLVYATCSLCRSENEDVVQAFLGDHPEFAVESLVPPPPLRSGSLGLTILPADVDSDAFFVSVLRRSAASAA